MLLSDQPFLAGILTAARNKVVEDCFRWLQERALYLMLMLVSHLTGTHLLLIALKAIVDYSIHFLRQIVCSV